jgi:hypothetical protein
MPVPKNLSNSLTGLVAKEANAFTSIEEQPLDSLKLQEIIGDPDTQPLSWNSQSKPSTGDTLVRDPNSPIEGDDIFFNGLFEGARFADKNGDWWDILSYDWEGAVTIQNVWRPRIVAVVSIQDIRRSIHSWTEPILQRVPPLAAGVDYGIVETREVK